MVFSLATSGAIRIDGMRMGLNYGLNKVRFPAPVKVGARVVDGLEQQARSLVDELQARTEGLVGGFQTEQLLEVLASRQEVLDNQVRRAIDSSHSWTNWRRFESSMPTAIACSIAARRCPRKRPPNGA